MRKAILAKLARRKAPVPVTHDGSGGEAGQSTAVGSSQERDHEAPAHLSTDDQANIPELSKGKKAIASDDQTIIDIGADEIHQIWGQRLNDNQIRLVHILPDLDDGDILCTLECYERRTAPSYHALSYTWGERSNLRSITCNGIRLQVTENCEDALRALRQAQITPVWIDAVCINQRDVIERSKQVARIGDMFRDASKTVIYIGHSNESSEFVFKTIRALQTHDERGARRLVQEYKYDSVQSRHDLWQRFLTRPWFGRTWIVQEVLLSRDLTLLCGSEQLEWKTFTWFIFSASTPWIDNDHFAAVWGDRNSKDGGSKDKVLKHNLIALAERVSRLHLLPPTITILQREYSHQYGKLPPSGVYGELADTDSSSGLDGPTDNHRVYLRLNFWRLPELLNATHGFGCEDPRDKLYALLPLFEQPIPKLLSPDYDKPVTQDYSDVSAYLLTNDDSQVLPLAGIFQSGPSMPSWAVDWRLPPIHSGLKEGLSQHGHLGQRWRAGFAYGQRHIHCERLNDAVIFVRGKIVEPISAISSACTEADTLDLVRLTIDQWKTEVRTGLNAVAKRQMLCPEPEGELLVDVRIDSVMTNGLRRPQGRKSTYDERSEHDALLRCNNRRLIFTTEGLIGLAPKSVEVGDVVSVLLGFHVPFVVRQHQDGWQLVGECLVPGIMEGEAVEDLDWERVNEGELLPMLMDFKLY